MRLLNEVLGHRGEEYLFNIAHENIGSRLRGVAEGLGYEVQKGTAASEVNIWGNPEKPVIYSRTEAVREP